MIVEHKLVLPTKNNHGDCIGWLHDTLRSHLCEEYGGFSAYEGEGGWVDPATGKLYREAHVAYIVAAEAGEATEAKLTSLARTLCGQADQECIYLSVNGRVLFIEGN